MASSQPQPNNFPFPYFTPPPSHPFNPPPSPSHPFNPPPPPPHSFAPPPPRGHPPPPPSPSPPPPPPPRRPFAPPPPHVRPPPSPHRPIAPPPPHVRPPPPPPPPSPSPNQPTVIIVVIVSLGGLALLSMLAFALFCCIQRRKKKTRETEVIHFDEHKTVKETIVPGPFGREVVQITVEDDVHIDEEIKKNETFGHHHGLHAKAKSSSSGEADQVGNSSNIEVGTTSPAHEHHHLENKS